MSASNIEWTDATWNPTVGCTKVSPGCKHCYAETMHARLTKMQPQKYGDAFTVVKPYPAHLDVPLRARKPRRYFVNSMSDLFHEDVPDEYIAAVFGVMAAAPQHTFQVLTKRAERMARWVRWLEGTAQAEASADAGHQSWRVWECLRAAKEILGDELRGAGTQSWPLPNVWIGVSVENQEQADARIPHLLSVPAAVRFLSCEPLLGPVDLRAVKWPGKGEHRVDVLRFGYWSIPERIGVDGFVNHSDMHDDFGKPLDWVIVGGESGPGARPCDLAWVRSLVKQCRSFDVPVFVKQLGAAASDATNGIAGSALKVPDEAMALVSLRLRNKKGGDMTEWPADLRVREFPKEMP